MEKIALILAAGASRRMNGEIPKTLNKICGKILADHVLDALDPVCKRKVMVVKYKMELVIDACASRAECIEQKDGGWGTGWAVISARELLLDVDRVIITCGDMPLVLSETYRKLDQAVLDGADAAMLYDTVDKPFGYGRVIRDENGMPREIVEQKDLADDQQDIREINASVFCFDAKSLLSALDELGCDNAANEYYLTDAIAALYNAGKRIVAIPTSDRYEGMGINTVEQLEEATQAYLERQKSNS